MPPEYDAFCAARRGAMAALHQWLTTNPPEKDIELEIDAIINTVHQLVETTEPVNEPYK